MMTFHHQRERWSHNCLVLWGSTCSLMPRSFTLEVIHCSATNKQPGKWFAHKGLHGWDSIALLLVYVLPACDHSVGRICLRDSLTVCIYCVWYLQYPLKGKRWHAAAVWHWHSPGLRPMNLVAYCHVFENTRQPWCWHGGKSLYYV